MSRFSWPASLLQRVVRAPDHAMTDRWICSKRLDDQLSIGRQFALCNRLRRSSPRQASDSLPLEELIAEYEEYEVWEAEKRKHQRTKEKETRRTDRE